MVAVLTKIVMNTVTEGNAVRLLTSPIGYILALVGVIATLLQQSAFHAGSLRASVPAMLVLEPVVAVLLGQVVLGEYLTANPPTAVILGIALAAMAAATIALGRDEGDIGIDVLFDRNALEAEERCLILIENSVSLVLLLLFLLPQILLGPRLIGVPCLLAY